MAYHIRSGKPYHLNGTTATATWQKWPITTGPTKHFLLQNTHLTESLRVALTEDAKNSNQYITLAAGYGLDLDVEITKFWTYSTNPCTFESLHTSRP